jgi:hypothetical protein
MFIRVDLPLPEGPSTLRNSPRSISRSTCLRTTWSSSPMGYTLVMPRMEKKPDSSRIPAPYRWLMGGRPKVKKRIMSPSA